MNHSLDEAVRSVLADITAAAPNPEDVALQRSTPSRAKARWLLPAVAAMMIAVVGGVVLLASGDDETSPASIASDDSAESEVSEPDSVPVSGPTPVAVEVPDQYDIFPTVAALVVERADPKATVVTIDHGSTDGIQVGMAVVAAEGFVGSISAVTETSSEVRLIADPASSFECAAGPSLVFECVGGADDRAIEITPAMQDALALAAGLDVVTVGSETSFVPDGLLVGRVSAERPGFVDPAADLSELHQVFVIRYVPATDVSGDTDEEA